jgi:hypothetical protein
MILNNEQQDELRRLKRNVPDFDVVYAAVKALQAGGANTDPLWEYYYPICLHKGWEFFEDPEDGHNAAFDLMEHWLKSVLTYNEEKAKISPFFDKVAKNFFINRKEHLDLGPEILYGGTPHDDDDDQEDDGDGLTYHKVPTEIGPDYPYPILQDGPLDIALLQERALTIREDLFPADTEVFDLLIEGYDSDEIVEILGKTKNAIALSMTRIRSLT